MTVAGKATPLPLDVGECLLSPEGPVDDLRPGDARSLGMRITIVLRHKINSSVACAECR
jgi:hypothetical protein